MLESCLPCYAEHLYVFSFGFWDFCEKKRIGDDECSCCCPETLKFANVQHGRDIMNLPLIFSKSTPILGIEQKNIHHQTYAHEQKVSEMNKWHTNRTIRPHT